MSQSSRRRRPAGASRRSGKTLKSRLSGGRPQIEMLEDRVVMTASAVLGPIAPPPPPAAPAPPVAGVESIDGTGNNLANPTWGSDNIQLLRTAPAQYTDGIAAPAGADRPSARLISDVVSAHPATSLVNNRDFTAFTYAWGQFLDHDIDLTTAATPSQAFNVVVPTGDAWFDPNSVGGQIIPLTRSISDPTTGTGAGNPRQQVNTITSFIDGSQIYGSDATRAAALRTFVGGHLKTSDGNLLPFNTMGLANANDAHLVANNQLFAAGDVRANENIELLAVQTLFVREHNRLADQIAKKNPALSDEAIYQQARQLVIAELQVITYNEFLPALLGDNAVSKYAGYKANVNPSIANEFSTAAFRFGHSMLGSDIEFLDNQGNAVHDPVALRDAFFNPGVLEQTGIDPILKYLASDRAEEIDTKVVDDVRNFLFGPPGDGGFDLASLNIQRGRDHGLADYNSTRAAYGLPRVQSFADITSDPTLQQQLKTLYGSVDKIDLWVGGLAEDHLPGSSLGPTFSRIMVDQFTRLRDGDRFWYQREFSPDQVKQLEQTTLADIVSRNTTTTNLQSDVFFLHASISGKVLAPPDAPGGQKAPPPAGLAGVQVELLDSLGNIVAMTTTATDGSYSFKTLDLGKYSVQLLSSDGTAMGKAIDVSITRGMDVQHIDLNLPKTPPAPPKAPPKADPPPQSGPVGKPAPPPLGPSPRDHIFGGLGSLH